MEYQTTLKCYRHRDVAFSSMAAMRVSRGDPILALAATQFPITVELTVNDHKMGFQLVENMLRSFLAGKFWQALHIDAYAQEDSRFVVRFAPPHTAKLNIGNRREIEGIRVQLDFAYCPTSGESVFWNLVSASDYALSGIIRTFSRIAPAVFNEKQCEKLSEIMPLLRPLKISLGLTQTNQDLETLTEGAVLSMALVAPRKSQRPSNGKARRQRGSRCFYPLIGTTEAPKPSTTDDAWTPQGNFFAFTEYMHRTFVVLTEDGDDIHEPFFLPNALSLRTD